MVGRTGSWILIVMIMWIGLSGIVIFGPGLIHWMTPQVAASVGGLSGLLTLILGFSSRTTAQQQEERSHVTTITDMAVRAAAPCSCSVSSSPGARQQLAIGPVRSPVWNTSERSRRTDG